MFLFLMTVTLGDHQSVGSVTFVTTLFFSILSSSFFTFFSKGMGMFIDTCMLNRAAKSFRVICASTVFIISRSSKILFSTLSTCFTSQIFSVTAQTSKVLAMLIVTLLTSSITTNNKNIKVVNFVFVFYIWNKSSKTL